MDIAAALRAAGEFDMTRILVLYGTTDGHTAKVAREITNTLWAHGVTADIADARRDDPDPRGYTGVIVAASVHAGGFQRAVKEWVRRHAGSLQTVPAAFVAVCLGVLQHDPAVDRDLDAIVGRFLDDTGWHPAERKYVAGALQYTRYGFLRRWAMRRIVAKAGGDVDTTRDYEYTDWADLRAFATGFAERARGRDAA
jgi:menaquinone-dependent protoporphyrinogen oxidase